MKATELPDWFSAPFQGVEVPSIPLDPAWAASGPVVCGATGGSGTRLIARALRLHGLRMTTHRNESEDDMLIADLLDRWIDPIWERGLAEVGPTGPVANLALVVQRLVSTVAPGAAWGWKEPRSMWLLPVFAQALPSMRFVHVIRDGRDMAFSANQNQLLLHGRHVDESDDPRHIRSARMWAALNLGAARWAADVGIPTHVVRYEDIIARPAAELRRVCEFAGLKPTVEVDVLAATVRAPAGALGRWRGQDPHVTGGAGEILAEALDHFRYPSR